MALLLHNIDQLHQISTGENLVKAGSDMQNTRTVENAWVWIEGGRIKALGAMERLPQQLLNKTELTKINCEGRLVFPGFVDSHTHLVFAAPRADEYVDRIKGLSYEEIARKGGGILNSAKKLQQMSAEELLQPALERIREVRKTGTSTLEIKSGYGLTLQDELKMLRVAQELKKHTPQRIFTTFLGAHAIPSEYKHKREAYIRLVIQEMIPRVAEEKLADFIDVFCDEGFFTVDETTEILEAGLKYGLRPKIHANELAISGGVQTGIKHQALSVDHLERIGKEEIEALQRSETMPTLLPGTSFFLGIPYAPARKLIQAGLPVALASDYNPGSSPTGNIPFIMALACNKMKLLPEEALSACTLNGASALGIAHETGSISVGKAADLLISRPMQSLAEIPYFFSRNPIEQVIINGKVIREEA